MGHVEIGKQFEFNWFNRKSAMNLSGIHLMQLGTVCIEPGYVVAPHTQWCYEISYFVSGSGEFVVDDTRIPIHPNEVFLTPLECCHSIVADKNESLHFCYVGFQFDEDNLDGELTQLRTFFGGKQNGCIPGSQDLMMAFYRAAGELAQAGKFSPMLLTGYIQAILIMSMRLFTDQTANPHVNLSGDKSSSEIIYLIMKAIDDNLMSLRSIADLAYGLGYHPCYLSHHFKERTGMTLQEYIAQKKMEHAIGLMRFSPLTITQIGERMGFSTLQAFSKAFKRVIGVSPTDYILQNNLKGMDG